jgi:poly(beta-D-mannuronate) lyase
VRASVPGDSVVLANGVWRDFEIVFTGEGTAAKPITLRAQTAGKVVISGKSNLRIGGRHLVVSGLTFKDGHSPSSEVIAFRRTARPWPTTRASPRR